MRTPMALLIVGLCVTGLTQAQWKTYSHPDPEFSIEYPAGWEAKTVENPEDEALGDVSLKAKGGAEFTGKTEQGNLIASVVVYESETDVSMEALTAGLKAQAAGRDAKTGKVNEQACAWYQESKGGQDSIHTYFAKGTTAYRVSLEAPTAIFAQCMSGYQHMLKSVKVRARGVATATAPGGGKLDRQGTKAGEEATGPDGAIYVWVPPGEFMMGSEDGDDDEKPVHKVQITKGFWLGKHEVTNAQYRSFCEATGKSFPSHSEQGDDHPVVHVSWSDAKAYCEHYGLSLPTEAQWEYAARGPEGRRYPWGDEWDAQRLCWQGNVGPGEQTFPVGSFPAGASWCGALDMAGNVRERCFDWYDADYYAKSPVDDPGGRYQRWTASRGGL